MNRAQHGTVRNGFIADIEDLERGASTTLPTKRNHTGRELMKRTSSHPDRAKCYRVPLQQPLPSIRIPLRVGDSDAPLQLQPLLDAAWENGDYGTISYATAPRPQFRPDDEVWIEHQIAVWKATQV